MGIVYSVTLLARSREMGAKEPMLGPGQFQWNTGGWFGSQLGCTAWMLVGAAVIAPQAPLVAAWWACCFVIANAVGTGLWWRRDRLSPYPAIQALLATVAVAGLLAVVSLHLFGPADVRLGVGIRDGRFVLDHTPGNTLRSGYAALLVGVPVMMAWFAFMERAGRRGKAAVQAPPG
jgi:hypothetical protein